jgi:hypothetical protein
MMMNGRSSFGLLLALAMLAAVAVVVFGGVRLYHRFATPRPHRTALPHTPPPRAHSVRRPGTHATA